MRLFYFTTSCINNCTLRSKLHDCPALLQCVVAINNIVVIACLYVYPSPIFVCVPVLKAHCSNWNVVRVHGKADKRGGTEVPLKI